MLPVAPRIVNNVSYVTDITYESHFAWQAQYLVILERHFLWQNYHNHGTAEDSFTWFGHLAGRSPCAHSIGKFFL